MSSCFGGARTLGQFALVSYIPGPLGHFIDRLRKELTPGTDPRAHVTVLPPRPLHSEIRSTVERLADETGTSEPFDVALREVAVFPKTNVLYLSLGSGERQLHALHENLNCGQLEYDGPFPFHPHVTVAQGLSEEELPAALERARELWASYDGPRVFTVETLSFVQNVAPEAWLDIAKLPLAVLAMAAV